ncbi:MAG: hypothetical protein RR653_04250 [Clostridia bacterium]
MFAYLKLLLRNWLAGYKPQSLQREGRSKARTIASYVGYSLLALYLYAMVLIVEIVLYDACKQFGEPQAVIAVAFMACTFITLFYSFFYVIATLFFSKDHSFVAALPISSHGVLTAKLCMVVVGELVLTLAVGAPLLLRYGIETGAGVLYYVRALLGTLFVPLVPIAISTLLSFVLIHMSALWKRREGMTTILSFAFLALFFGFEMHFVNNVSDEQMGAMIMGFVFGQGSITAMVLRSYPPLQWLTNAVTGSGVAAWGYVLLFIALSVAAIGLVILLCGKRYMYLALKQEETLRRLNAGKKRENDKNQVRKPFWAFYRQEMRNVITVPVYATNCLAGTVMFPVLMVIMLLGLQKQMPQMSMFEVLTSFIPRDYILILTTAGMCFTTVMNMAVSTAVSREGKGYTFPRVFPATGATRLMAKLLMGMTYNIITTLFSAIVLWVLLPSFWVETLIAMVLSQLFSLLFSALGLLGDVYHPRLNWKNETEAIKQNMNGMVSMLIGIGGIAALVGVFMAMLHFQMGIYGAFAVVILLVIVMDFLVIKWLRGKASAIYCFREYTN